MALLAKLKVCGFKSIREQEIAFDEINLLIGPNGAGKSNLVSVFHMLNYMITEGLEKYVAQEGYANSLLFLGASTTPVMEISLNFVQEDSQSDYLIKLAHAAHDTLVFVDEIIGFHKEGHRKPFKRSLGAGHRETLLSSPSEKRDKTASVIRHLLSRCRVYQFHDTSSTAWVRQYGRVDDNRFLRSNGGNLAAYLYALSQGQSDAYRKIVDSVRRIAPNFRDFYLEPSRQNPERISLQWTEKGSDYLFSSNQLPDGMLRFICLSTLLLQPDQDLPDVIVIDEPELGLHPKALSLLSSQMNQVAKSRQIIAATQSTTLLDNFEPENVVVVERVEGESVFRRPERSSFQEWVSEYSTGELWQKNIIGGRP
jgi:predicted ATPase